jgi:hypothetical protein
MKISRNQLQLDLHSWFQSPEREAWLGGAPLDRKVRDFYKRLHQNNPEACEWSLNFYLVIILQNKSEEKLQQANLPFGNQLAAPASMEASAVVSALHTLALERDKAERIPEGVVNLAMDILKQPLGKDPQAGHLAPIGGKLGNSSSN